MIQEAGIGKQRKNLVLANFDNVEPHFGFG